MNIPSTVSPIRTVLSCLFALIAFAANSVLCRLALGEDSIDAASFTVIRLVSGAITLGLISLALYKIEAVPQNKNWSGAFFLFLYAICFSFAYISLDTGTGALILFTSVQLSMITISILSGSRLHWTEIIGTLIAFGGFLYLIYPHLTAPSLMGFILMTIAGIAWGFYSLIGRGSKNPLHDTKINFYRSLPFALILAVFAFNTVDLSTKGIILAMTSGAIASGIGYAIWYTALGGLSAVQAAVAQLLVPVIAAYGGVLFANEQFTQHLLIAMLLILSGILIVVLGKNHFQIRIKK